MSAMQELPRDHALRVAWEQFKKSDEYANSLKWAKVFTTEVTFEHGVRVVHPHIEGSMWNLFMQGWFAHNAYLEKQKQE